jgi:hypothetical protein
MNKVFKIVVNPDDETGVDFNSFVDVPAHMKGFMAFGKNQPIHYSFNDEKRMVTGVLISAGTLIERFSKELGQHWVLFDAETIDIINKKTSKRGDWGNLNLMHDPKQVTKGAYMTERYIVSNSDPKKPNVPEALSQQGVNDGSLIGTYHITDDKIWQDVKDGKFNGFSVEGWFEKQEINLKTKMNKQKKSIWDLFKKESQAKEVFATATTAEGVAVMYDGELAVGTALSVEADGVTIPAPEGEHQLTLEDGSVKIVVLNAEGVVESVQDFEANADEDEEEMNSIREEVADAMTELAKEIHSRFDAVEAENKRLNEENEALKAEFKSIKESDKFGADPKKGTQNTDGKMTIKEIVSKKKN